GIKTREKASPPLAEANYPPDTSHPARSDGACTHVSNAKIYSQNCDAAAVHATKSNFLSTLPAVPTHPRATAPRRRSQIPSRPSFVPNVISTHVDVRPEWPTNIHSQPSHPRARTTDPQCRLVPCRETCCPDDT